MKVMIADDQDAIRFLYKELLSEHGCEIVAETGNGYEALHAYFVFAPDLIILDHHMEAMTGIEVARAIIGQDEHAKIVICTANSEEVRDEALQLGVIEVLSKPFDVYKFMEIILHTAKYGCD